MDLVGPAEDRKQLRRAVVAEVARTGLAQCTVSSVIAAASVSRETFYGCYSHLDDCYLDALAPLRDALRDTVGRGNLTAAESIEAFEHSLRPVLEVLARDQDLTYCLLFEPPDRTADRTFSDGPSREALVAIIDRLFDGRGAQAADAYAAMLHQMIAQRVAAGRAHELPALAEVFGDLLRTHAHGLERRRDAG